MKIQKAIVVGVVLMLPLAVLAQGGSDGSGDRSGQNRGSRDAQVRLTDTNHDLEAAREAAREGIERKRQEVKTEVEKKKDEICKRVTSRLDSRINHSSKHKSELDQRYLKVEARWQRLIDRAKAKGVDATKLEADLVKFKEMHAVVNADFDALQAALQNTTNHRCGYSNGDFRKSLSSANAEWKQLQADRKALRDFRHKVQQEDIVPLLKALAQIQSTTNTENTQDKTQ